MKSIILCLLIILQINIADAASRRKVKRMTRDILYKKNQMEKVLLNHSRNRPAEYMKLNAFLIRERPKVKFKIPGITSISIEPVIELRFKRRKNR